MGLFSSTKVSVQSSVLNLAGDFTNRPSYLKTTVIDSILAEEDRSVGADIVNSYLKGPGIKLRSYFRWADNGYGFGLPDANVGVTARIDTDILKNEIPTNIGNSIYINSATIGALDFEYFAAQWIMENRPDDLFLDWEADVESVGSVHTMTILFPDMSTVSFVLNDFDNTSTYIYARYYEVPDTVVDPSEYASMGEKLYIYRIGSGNSNLDSSYTVNDTYSKFFPTVPVRIDNDWVNNRFTDSEINTVNKAVLRATNRHTNLNKLIDKVTTSITNAEGDDAASLSDIDHVFMVHGVSLNTLSYCGKLYLYNFFEKLRTSQAVDEPNYQTTIDEQNATIATNTARRNGWDVWLAAQSDVNDPLYGTTAPNTGAGYTMTGVGLFGISDIAETANTLDFTTDSRIPFNPKIGWNFITKETFAGLGKVGAEEDDVWIEKDAGGENIVLLYKQHANTYTILAVHGLLYTNPVYGSKEVRYTGIQALDDVEESGFIVPLHYQTFREMPIVQSTQLSMECGYLVFNVYEVVKVKWWKRLLAFALAFVLTLFSGVGILGSNAIIGSVLGLSGTAATVVGALINTFAGMFVGVAIEKVLSTIFGAKLGAIIGAVIGFLVSSGTLNFNKGGALLNWSNLTRIDNIMKLGDALTSGISGWLRANSIEMIQEGNDYITASNRTIWEIEKKRYEEFGNGAALDPTRYIMYGRFPTVDLDYTFDYGDNPIYSRDNYSNLQLQMPESPDSFLSRTLMTGMDNVKLSIDMVTNFTTITTALPTR